MLKSLDLIIIFVYLALTIGIGIWISKKASKNLDSYFLGSKAVPWYILGISNASGMFDISGTMWLVYLIFVYGLKGAWIPWMWPVFNQIFLMVYLSSWVRRSNVLTGAEWITTRFGDKKGGKLAHISVVIFALMSVTGFLAYSFEGIGKFAAEFLPWDLAPHTYGLIITLLTSLYVIKGGMFSVVFTEVLQFFIMTISSFAIGIIAMIKVSPDMLANAIPDGWKTIWFGWKLDLDWTGILDSVNTKIQQDEYSFFTIIMMMMLFKGILVSLAGPAPNYDMQRVLATRSPKEASKMSGLVSLVLFFPRYMMIGGLAVLALAFFLPELRAMGPNVDFEMILPYAIKNFLPVGLVGLLIAGLLAAFMSTYAATVNAAPAYIVNDIYKKYINPNASDKKYIRLSYIASAAIIILGILFGYAAQSVNYWTMWIVSALWGGYAASNVLKWYWWRLNGYGYFWGMAGGMLCAACISLISPSNNPLFAFPIILAVSTLGCIIGSLLTEPDDEEVLKNFYTRVRPWGFWGPVKKKVMAENPSFKPNKDFKRDMFNIIIGIIWQTTLVVLPIYIIIREKTSIINGIVILVITSFILKKNWYNKLED
ncbi:MAG: Na+:solute symporter [Oligoflexia bacterium]|nr:Na+:solute symporter [Oligoflexia bacterium]